MKRSPLCIQQVRALAARSLGNEYATALECGGMVLHHLHVHKGRAHLVRRGHAVTRAYQSVGARLEHAPKPARCDDDRLRAHNMDFAAANLHNHRARALAILNNEREQEPFLINADARLHHLFVKYMQQRLTGEVRYEECARLPLPAERARAKTTLVVSIEYDAHMLHRDDFVTGLAAHHGDGILVAQVVAALDGIEGMLAPVVASIGERGVDAALRRVGVAANRMHLRYDRDIRACLYSGKSGTHTRKPGADYQHIMVEHIQYLVGQYLLGQYLVGVSVR